MPMIRDAAAADLEDLKDSTYNTLPRFSMGFLRTNGACVYKMDPAVSYSAKKVIQERIYQSKITHKRCFKG